MATAAAANFEFERTCPAKSNSPDGNFYKQKPTPPRLPLNNPVGVDKQDRLKST
jgi:hypothetical protein